ncbi:PepSY domain-containing protein [Spongiibacter taiwanensis]|uniref:PepSY-associated TM helix domain-containing protein n=1 Tax=Spongiibacter taiwanensis TaxID=1748242 RepID=UPI002035B298|nr:PepSY-associated TM helix domain-containing protein [Spongiibacter taiwanensis]USA42079.1 PepSY domain-containing protein [Spongiibacter taiwanensis]
MRSFFTLAHRYLGLGIALFLIVTGLTGAIISWDHELDEWLNGHLLDAATPGTPQSATALAHQVETQFPQVQVTYYETATEPGHSYYYWVEPRVNPDTGELYKPGFNQIYVDPVSGEILGMREWGAVWPVSRENFVSFLYMLHFSLHIPEFNDIHWGVLLLGVVALIWTIDCFIGFYLTLPNRRKQRSESDTAGKGKSWWQRWAPAWKIRRNAGSYKLNFDLHRAFGLWTWVLLFTIAFTGFSLNLYREVFFPVMSLVSDVTPTPIDSRTPSGHHNPIQANFGFERAIELGEQEAAQKGWTEPVGSLWHAIEFGIYRLEFFTPEEGHGAGGVGHKAIYIDSKTGENLGDWRPWEGTAADLFVQAQFPLHSGRILGLPGRILISVMGVVVAMLSITGIIIWVRKRRARILRAERARQEEAGMEYSASQ